VTIDHAVTVNNLSMKFGNFIAVNQINFTVNRGEIFGFLGPNGCGKSTTIRMLCGIITPSSGSGTVAGFDIIKDSEKIRTKIGYMSQKFSLYEDLTVDENIQFFADIYDVPLDKIDERRSWILEMAGLTERADSLAGELSTGWKQRLALGCAMVHSPEVLFLDEPTGGVDPVSRRQFWTIIDDMAHQGVTVFVTTHYMDEAEHCQRLALMYAGKLIALDTPANLKKMIVEGMLLKISAEPVGKALELLIDYEEVVDVSIFGTDIHVMVESAGMEENLAVFLRSNGIIIHEVIPVSPSLEDLFIHLMGIAEEEVL
jgi:ABC-2 type transport system ATP-binding protein